MTFIGRFANRNLKRHFSTLYAVKDYQGLVGGKFNNLFSARAFARKMSLQHNGISFSVWSGHGFTVKVGLSFRDGNRRRGR